MRYNEPFRPGGSLTSDPAVDFQALRTALEQRLSPHRFRHSLGVAETARRLASRYGADPEASALAGLLHDVAREMPAKALWEAAEAQGEPLGYMERMAPMPCLHGPVGASVAARELGVTDPEILGGITCHTLGKERMSVLEKVVFLADAIEPNREAAPHVLELRALADQDLNLACRRAFDLTFEYLLRTAQPLHPQAAAARNWLLYEAKFPEGAPPL